MSKSTRTEFRGLAKCLSCGAVAVKHYSSSSNAAVRVELTDIDLPFVSRYRSRVYGRVTVEIFSIDSLHKGDLTLVPHVLQRGLDRFLSEQRL